MQLRFLVPLVAACAAVATAFTLPTSAPIAPGTETKAGTYSVDAVHSTVIFRALHMGSSWSFGRFDKIEGSFTLDPAKPEACKVSIKIDTASVDTDNADRDKHLSSPDFLDVKQFPNATFESTSVKKKGEKTYAVTGDFTLHGVKKSVTIDLEHIGSNEHPMAGSVTGFYGELTIDRMEYGISYSPEMLGKDVKLMLSIEGQLQKK